jgi:hypothetical protein
MFTRSRTGINKAVRDNVSDTLAARNMNRQQQYEYENSGRLRRQFEQKEREQKIPEEEEEEEPRPRGGHRRSVEEDPSPRAQRRQVVVEEEEEDEDDEDEEEEADPPLLDRDDLSDEEFDRDEIDIDIPPPPPLSRARHVPAEDAKEDQPDANYLLNPSFIDYTNGAFVTATSLRYPATQVTLQPKKTVVKTSAIQITTSVCKDRIVFLDFEVHNRAQSKRISQIACISLDGTRVFNRYVYWKPLQESWQTLVDQKLVMYDPWDDPASPTFYGAMKELCEHFQQGTLFVFQGETDYSWLLKNLYIYQGDNLPLTRETRTLLAQREFRFVSINVFLRHPRFTELSENDKKLQRDIGFPKPQLGRTHDAFFHYSLLFLEAGKRFVYDTDIGAKVKAAVERSFKLVSIDVLEERCHGSSFYMPYWTSSHLQPIAHFAHSDVQMLRNVVLAWLVFLDVDVPDEEVDARDRFANVMTALVLQCGFFRERHLTVPETAAKFLFSRLAKEAKPLNNQVLDEYLDKENRFTEKMLQDDPVKRVRNLLVPYAAVPHIPGFRADADVEERKLDKLKVPIAQRLQVTVHGVTLPVKRPVFKDKGPRADRIDVMRSLMLKTQHHLPLPGKNSPFSFNPFIQEAERSAGNGAYEWDRVVGDRPWYVILNQAGQMFPKTLILHSRRCPTLVDPNDIERARPAYKSDLYIVNFAAAATEGSWPQLPFYLKFCKECKQHGDEPRNRAIPKYTRPLAPIGKPPAAPTRVYPPDRKYEPVSSDDDDDAPQPFRMSLHHRRAKPPRASYLDRFLRQDPLDPRASFKEQILASQLPLVQIRK